MKDEKCIFCKLANGEIPTNSIYEDDDFKVILDASPATKGHALILPKEHYANIFEIDEKVAGKILPLAKKVATKMTKELGCDGVNILQNNGEAAGQTVFHLHVHVIPRWAGDGAIQDWEHKSFTEAETAEIVKKLSM
ncbi:histidine triad (HIT) family protein [Pseudobutyrivibrio sp. YE44]|uniref:HIT family protein n=1 Tax=Pseudobutyrivibrio sp. YE44 TaxID=1520802 RepID=UPI000890586E|nr:HIT family protein [Pseudobutyrivibrio sp. YE44]SDB37492.1 histidine triad (HIT) family protein [Pseudobutyrivibrio sp. YE44]